MLKFRFVLNEMTMEIEELTEATSHGFAISFSSYLTVYVLLDLNCLIPKGLSGTS